MNNLGERLYELRSKNAMSQGALAERLDVSRQTISKWENNISIPELDKIVLLSNLFGVSVDYIVKGEGGEMSVINETGFEAPHISEPVRMIRVDPTEKIIRSLSIALGAIYLITLLVNSGSLISNFMHGYVSTDTAATMLASMAISFFTCGCLLSGKHNLLSISYILTAIYSFVDLSVNNAFDNMIAVLNIAAYLLIAVLYFKGNKKNSQLIGALIILCLLASFIWQGANMMRYFIDYNGMTFRNAFISLVNTKIYTMPYLIVNIGSAVLMYLRANPKPAYEVAENEHPVYDEMYVGMVGHILLSIFTLGIYNCIWTYKTTENLNCLNNEIQSGAKKLLLCIFVPFYRLYWYYNQSKRLEGLMKAKDENASEFAIVTLILAIFVPVVAASAFLQVKINEYAKKKVD